MNSVVGVAGLLASTPLDDSQVEYVNTIRALSDAVLALVDDLIDLPNGVRRDASNSALDQAWEKLDDSAAAKGLQKAGRRLLLVEDNRINRRVITRLLEKLGHNVQTAGNGREACEAVESNDFDLIFMDIQMPEMDGIEATRFIRKNIASSRQPWIVALTAAIDREPCRRAGADDHLNKPVRAEDLQDAILRAERGKQRAV
ncbi:MAG: CheY-like chemotaxis protein [Rhodothermales bacterium]|jgi:CheY-like chemotaxis protein